MTEKATAGGMIVLVALLMWLACAVHGCREEECKAKGGELHGFRDPVCVKPGSVIR